MPADVTELVCTACGNDREFDTIKTYFHKTILDGSGQVESSRPDSDLEGEELEVSCRRCGAPVHFPTPEVPLATTIEAHLEKIDEERYRILEEISGSREVSLEAGEDLAVATGAITDALAEIREQLQEHALHPTPQAHKE